MLENSQTTGELTRKGFGMTGPFGGSSYVVLIIMILFYIIYIIHLYVLLVLVLIIFRHTLNIYIFS